MTLTPYFIPASLVHRRGINLISLALVAYALWDALDLRRTPQHYWFAFAATVAALLVAIPRLNRLRMPPPFGPIIFGWVGFSLFSLVFPLMWTEPPFQQVVTTFLLSLGPPAMLLAWLTSPWRLEGRALQFVAVGYGAAAVLAALVGADEHSGRFDAPSVLAVAWFWVRFGQSPTLRKGLPLAVLLPLTVASGYRASMVAFVLAGVYVFWVKGTSSRFGLAAIAILAITLVATGSLAPLEVAERTRFAQLGAPDEESLAPRSAELHDVALDLATWWPHEWLVGKGHAATYSPAEAYQSNNILPDGTIHHIHFGPARLLFRYGLVGLVGFVVLIAMVVRSLFGRHTQGTPFFSLALGLVLLESMFSDVTLAPEFSYLLAGFLIEWYRRRRDRRITHRALFYKGGTSPPHRKLLSDIP